MSQVSSSNTPEEVPNYTILKAIVIFLGVLLVAGFALVFGTIFYRLSGGEDDVPTEGIEPSKGAEITISVPPGAQIVETENADGTIIVRHKLNGGGEQLTLIEAKSGKVLSTVTFQEQ